MEPWMWAVIAAVVVLIIALVIWSAVHKKRRRQLQERFGAEYDRTINERGSRRRAEAALQDRLDARERLTIRPLTAEKRERYSREWHEVQARFVDQPTVAVAEADALVTNVMRDRGYPVDSWDQKVDLVSVDHPELTQHYRAAHRIHERNLDRSATTEDLREAVLHYRSLFDELLAESGSAMAGHDARADHDWS